VSNILAELLSDHTLRTIALGSALLGAASGALGCFAVLRRQSLLGDAISHAALPGVALAFIATNSKQPGILLAGAAAAGWLGTLAVGAITRRSRVKLDAALGIVLSVFFGFGLVLLTWLQQRPQASQAGLSKYLFGSAATLLNQDILLMAAVALLSLAVLAALWPQFKLLAFDPGYAQSLGLPLRPLELTLSALLVAAIVIGLQTVGVVLMSAMLVAPAAAARQWTDRLAPMVLLAAALGAGSGVAGAVLSARVEHLPTGPSIVLIISSVVLFSLLFAPNRGLIFAELKSWRQRRELGGQMILVNLLRLARQHDDPAYPHRPTLGPGAQSGRQLRRLENSGWIAAAGGGLYRLTPEGQARASELEAALGREPA
jgi:manganese/zinc/iron transport system permease protein